MKSKVRFLFEVFIVRFVVHSVADVLFALLSSIVKAIFYCLFHLSTKSPKYFDLSNDNDISRNPQLICELFERRVSGTL